MIIVTAIRPFENGFKKRVHLLNTKTNAEYTLTYGDSVTDRWIRMIAPTMVGKAGKPTKGRSTR